MSTPGESHAVPAQITLIARHNAPVGDLSAIVGARFLTAFG